MYKDTSQRRNIPNFMVFLLLLFGAHLVLQDDLYGQNYIPTALRPGSSAGSASLSNFETINPYNGNLNFSLPIVESKGRGRGSFPINLNINQKFFAKEWYDKTGYPYKYVQEDNWGQRVWGDKNYVPSRLMGSHMGAQPNDQACPGTPVPIYYMTNMSLSFTAPDGSQYDFRDRNTNGRGNVVSCYLLGFSRGTIFDSVDGSGAVFTSDEALRDQPFGNLGEDGYRFFPSGIIKTKDGTTYRIDGGYISWSRDSNGNTTTFTYLSSGGTFTGFKVTDSMNREVLVEFDVQEPAPYGLCDRITYKGNSGTPRVIRVSYKSLHDILRAGQSIQTGVQLFPDGFSNFYPYYYTEWDGLSNYDPVRASDVWLPDGRKYEFKYNSYGEMARVQLPTGAAIEYDWGANSGTGRFDSQQNNTAIYRRILERRVYADGATLENKLTLSGLEPLGNRTGYVNEDTLDGAGNLLSRVKHYYYGIIGPGDPFIFFPYPYYLTTQFFHEYWRNGREYQTEVYANPGTVLLRRTTYSWSQLHPSWWTYLPEYAPTNNPRLYETRTLLADTNQVSSVVNNHDAFGNVIDTYEYDYGVGGSGNPGALLRRSHTNYLTTNPVNGLNYASDSIHITGLPTETWVSSDAAGENIVSRVTYEYDNYASDANHAPLVTRANITGHDAAYDANFGARGNATKVTGYATAQSQGGAVSSYRQYDIAGNPVKAIDARGYANTLDYTDNFGAANAEARTNSGATEINGFQTFGFGTKATNPKGYESYTQFDFYTGAIVDNEDWNGNVNSTFFDTNDPLDRPKQIITANNRSELRRQTSMVYDDSERKTTFTSDSKVFNDDLIKTVSYSDKLGRPIESRQYETAVDYIVTLQQYDALGRAFKTSNPFRPYLGETPRWTTTIFDTLGRTSAVQYSDGTVATRSYLGLTTTVNDQSLRKRSGTSDALGRLVKVSEDPLGLNYETVYQYDVLGRLRKSSQASGQISQNRYFMYDDLGRLIRAKQVEQLANSGLAITDPVTENSSWSSAYAYDNNGNVTSMTDANGKTISATYDNLNRISLRDYSDPSMADVSFTYDNPNVANSKGRLTAVSSSSSTTSYTAFDLLGRIKSSSQTTSGQTYSMPDYTYDLSGALVAQTYPSGRVVATQFDDIGRLNAVRGHVPNRDVRTYLSDISYASFGAIGKSRLGNGVWELSEFDPDRLQVTRISAGASAGSADYLKIDYEYGALNYGTGQVEQGTNNGNLAKQTIAVPSVGSSPGFTATQYYGYDTLNRLEVATENYTVQGSQQMQLGWRQQFVYDRFGNRRFDAANTTTLPVNNGIYNPNISMTSNRLETTDGYQYDSYGNLTSNPENQVFTYDSDNRLSQVQDTVTQQTAIYIYDGSGRRVKKVIGNKETIFVYDAYGKLLAEYTTNQTVTTEGTKYLTTDPLGSPRVITDIGGAVVSRHDYMPFGEETTGGGRNGALHYLVNGDGVRQQFTGYERDVESGLDYAQARYYSGKHGRFTSADPLLASGNPKSPQSLNRYTYALNNPYKFTDSTGLRPCDSENRGEPVNIPVCDDDPPFIIEQVEFKIPRDETGNRENTCKAELASCGGDDEEPSVKPQKWYVYEEKLAVRECHNCGPWDVGSRIGMVRTTVAYYPDEVNTMLYEFAQLEAQTAEEDEAGYALWYASGAHAISIGIPVGVSYGSPPPDRLYQHDKNIEDRVKASVDKAAGEGRYNEHQATMLKAHAREVINKTANEARQIGTDRFHFKNPSVRQHHTRYYNWRRQDVTRPMP